MPLPPLSKSVRSTTTSALFVMIFAATLAMCASAQPAPAGQPEAALAGAWQGEFTDGSGSHRVELVLWPGRIQGMAKIVGYLRLVERPCVAQALVNDFGGGRVTLALNPRGLRLDGPNCQAAGPGLELLAGSARIIEHADDNTIGLLLALPGPGLDGSQPARCASGVVEPGCFAVGRLRRAPASAEALALVASAPSTLTGAPDAEAVALLQSGRPATAAVQQEHAGAAAARDAEVLRQQQAAAERERAEAAERQRWAEAARPGAPAPVDPIQTMGPIDGPFAGGGGQYLNALLAGDQPRLDALDRLFRHPYIEVLSSDRQAAMIQVQQMLMGPWGSVEAGEVAHRRQMAAARELSLVQPVALAYVLGYEHQFPAACMDAEPLVYTRERFFAGSVVQTLSGIEISRTPGHVEVSEFRINHRLREVFEAGGDEISNGWLALTDLLLRQPESVRIADLGVSLHDAMRRLGCDSDEMRSFERALLERWRHVQRQGAAAVQRVGNTSR